MTDRPNKNHREKKSETIEVRVSYSEKQAFMEACKRAGTTASHAIRDYIGEFLNPQTGRPAYRSLPVLTGVLVAFVLVLVVLFARPPSQVPLSTAERVLNHFDRNGDGFLSSNDSEGAAPQEAATVSWLLSAADKNADARVDAAEVAGLTDIMVEVQAKNAGTRAPGEEKILVLPPNLTPEEQQEFLEQSGAGEHLSVEERTRLLRILNALAIATTSKSQTSGSDVSSSD